MSRRFRDHPQLLHHPQGVEVSPRFHYLAIGESLDSDARYLHALARWGAKGLRLTLVGTTAPKAHHDRVPFGHHVLYGVLKIGKGFAEGGCELPGPFYAPHFSGGRLMANVVGGKDLLDDVEVARVVVEFLDLPTHYGLVLFFGGHNCILLSDPLQLQGSSFSTTSMMPPAEVRRELRRTPSRRSSQNSLITHSDESGLFV